MNLLRVGILSILEMFKDFMIKDYEIGKLSSLVIGLLFTIIGVLMLN
jgi:hypothetical protein